MAVEPIRLPVITQALAGEEIKPSPHKIQGIGAGFVPKNLDLSIVDKVELVSDDESKAMALRLMQERASCAASPAVQRWPWRCDWRKPRKCKARPSS